MNDRFHLEINSLDDFFRFIEIIKGKEIDPKEIKKLTETLNLSTDSLAEAVNREKTKNG